MDQSMREELAEAARLQDRAYVTRQAAMDMAGKYGIRLGLELRRALEA